MQVFTGNLKLPHTTCHSSMSTRPCLLRPLTEHERTSLLVSFAAPYVAKRPDPDTRERRPVLVTDISSTTRTQKAQYIRSAFKWYELDQGRRAFVDWNTPPPLDDPENH